MPLHKLSNRSSTPGESSLEKRKMKPKDLRHKKNYLNLKKLQKTDSKMKLQKRPWSSTQPTLTNSVLTNNFSKQLELSLIHI